MISRRTLLAGSTLCAGALRSTAFAAETSVPERLAALEHRAGGRIGIAMLDSGSGSVVGHRLDELFPLCSTHKVLSAAFVLARVDAGQEQLDRSIVFGADKVIAYSPVTKLHADRTGLTLKRLCDAAVTVSDNTAANLLLESFGGPQALTAYLRTRGDTITRLDRGEPELNEARPNDPRDTTSPRAMAALLRNLVLGTALTKSSQTLLQGWMVDCQTGVSRIRAGVPADWRVGDKTGSGGGDRNAVNDVAVLWRPNRSPLIVTAYTIDTAGNDDGRNALLREVGRIATAV